MGSRIESFRELEIWKLGMEIAQRTYRLTFQLPKEEQYGLIAQMRRASISLPANIAEGFRRRYNREYRQFLHVSLGSSAELETYLELAKKLYTLDEQALLELLTLLDRFQRMTNTLIGKLKV